MSLDEYIETGDGWNIYTKKDVERLIDDGAIEEPEEYGFDSVREMTNYVLGRGDYLDNNKFRESPVDRRLQNKDAPKALDFQETIDILNGEDK